MTSREPSKLLTIGKPSDGAIRNNASLTLERRPPTMDQGDVWPCFCTQQREELV
jgi:hypothetical protein